MPKANQDNRTRQDYVYEHVFGRLVGTVDRVTEDRAKEMAAETIAREDERIWAWYRDPLSDLTQTEARDRAQTHEYGRYNISQSSLSRKLSKLDETMFTGEISIGNGDGDISLFTEEWYDAVDTTPDLQELYKETLARFLCDLQALDELEDAESPTPEWVADRFPDADPNLGRKLGKRMGYHKEGVELHEPQDWTSKQAASGDD